MKNIMITWKKNSGSQSGTKMKVTPRGVQKSFTGPKMPFFFFSTQTFTWIYKPVQNLKIDFRLTTRSTKLQLKLWILLLSRRWLLVCTAKFKTVGVDFSLTALI